MKEKRHTLLILFICLIMSVSILYINSILINKKINTHIYSLSVKNYELDKNFDSDKYDYSVYIDSDSAEIICETDDTVTGCNQVVDLTGKNIYEHQIQVSSNDNLIIYRITFIKVDKIPENSKNEDNDYDKNNKNEDNETNNDNKNVDFSIKSVKGNSTSWTNKDITLEVIMSDNDIYQYSFDNGKTYQENNKYIVDSNKTIKIIAKNKDGKTSNSKKVVVDKIDKTTPSFTTSKTKQSSSKIVLEVKAYDTDSGIDYIDFNGKKDSKNTNFDITKAGTYYIQVKDKAGNISEKQNIEIKSSDFVEVKSNTFKVTLNSNGATVENKDLSCTTTEKSCEIILPKITSSGEVLGWSRNKYAKSADYMVGQTLKIDSNFTLYAITKKTFTANFNKNGANSIGSSSATCTAYNLDKCEITTPTITSNGTIIGWSSNKNAKTSEANVNTKIELTNSKTFYAITKKTFTANFNKNAADSISKNTATCTAYNLDKCEITTPTITSSGTVIGWNSNKNATTLQFMQNSNIELTNNITLYAVIKKSFTANFYKNGANYIGSSSESCNAYNFSKCEITTPYIDTNGEPIGWSSNQNATSLEVAQNTTIELTSDKKYYAITYKNFTANFSKNGADSISGTSKNCSAWNANKCEIITPTITSSGTVLGWNSNKNATTSEINANATIELTSNRNYFAITKKTYTATFRNINLNYLESSTKSCTVYNTSTSCSITLPEFNRSGYFNNFWSIKEEASSNLSGREYSNDYFKPVNQNYTLSSNITFYPNFNSTRYTGSYNYGKYRYLSVDRTIKKGNTTIEFESGIPSSIINNYISKLDTIYSKMPYLFHPCKVFAMTPSTYSKYSAYYGLTHNVNIAYNTIDIQYDSYSGAFDYNVLVHELGHVWDHYYSFKTGNGSISNQTDFINFYNSISSKIDDYDRTETWAAMVSNYYFHKLGMDQSQPYYALKSGYTLSSSELSTLETLIQKYKNY